MAAKRPLFNVDHLAGGTGRLSHGWHEAESWMTAMLSGGADPAERQPASQPGRRLFWISIIFGIFFLLLLGRLFAMQVVSGDQYAALANGNRVREIVTYAPRGRVLDRDGRVLADNTLAFQLSGTPFLVEDDLAERAEDVARIARIVGVEPNVITRRLLRSGEEYGLPLVILERLTHEQALRLESIITQLKGFSLDQVPVRRYVERGGLAHVVGYTGRVSTQDLEADRSQRLLPTDFIGKTGIELTFDDRLRGENGWQRIEVDALGRPVRVIAKQEPRAGEDLRLSIDFKVQEAMYKGVLREMREAKAKRGAAVAVHPGTGEVLALISVPAFSHNDFARGISTNAYNRLANDPNQPLFNKALSGGYTTGSIIKPLVAAAGLQEGVVDEHTTVVDRGYIDVISEIDPSVSFRFRGWNPAGLGTMNLRSAIAMSSNIYFFHVGGGFGPIRGLGEERLTTWYRRFGLGEETGIDLPNELLGRVPDAAWKQEAKGEGWFVGDTYNISIGQGDFLISPLQITMANGAIVNDGYLLKPQLLADAKREVRRELPIDKRNLQIVREGERQVLTGGLTCECVFNGVPVKVAGKSGTAETDTPAGKRPNAWFFAYAPYDEPPEFMATVLIEEGYAGSTYAAPPIAEGMKAWFRDRD